MKIVCAALTCALLMPGCGEGTGAMLEPVPENKGDVPSNVQDMGWIGFGEQREGEFTENGQFFGYAFYGSAGASVTVEILRAGSSAGLDTSLFVFGPKTSSGFGGEPMARDNDAGYGNLSRIEALGLSFPGIYLVVVGTADGRDRGLYRLLLSCESAPCDALTESWEADIGSTDLQIDVSALRATARITFRNIGEGGVVSLATGDLDIRSITSAAGEELRHETEGETTTAVVDPARQPLELLVDYGFRDHTRFDGWNGASGYSFLWPYFCGNLFPCAPAPASGSTFALAVSGVPDGQTAVYPPSIGTECPAYMPAVSIGGYVYRRLGETAAGTEVGVYYFPASEADALAGTTDLVEFFGFFEETYGAYAFGAKVASVAAAWGPGSYGGMEHHPFWHIAPEAMSDPSVHAHEAAHGWFGNGVRIRCWEDFVLSEGTSSYLESRALIHAGGETTADEEWRRQQQALDDEIAAGRDTAAWPEGCNRIDILTHPIWSAIPYKKGALFLHAVELQVGLEALDAVLRGFYEQNVGRAAGMQDLVDAIRAGTGFDPSALVTEWLKSPPG